MFGVYGQMVMWLCWDIGGSESSSCHTNKKDVFFTLVYTLWWNVIEGVY